MCTFFLLSLLKLFYWGSLIITYAHLCLLWAFILNLSEVCCYWPLEIFFSLFSESLVHPIILLLLVRVASFLHLPKMKGVPVQSLSLLSFLWSVSVEIVLQSVISYAHSVDNSKLSLALTFLLSSSATFSNTQWTLSGDTFMGWESEVFPYDRTRPQVSTWSST